MSISNIGNLGFMNGGQFGGNPVVQMMQQLESLPFGMDQFTPSEASSLYDQNENGVQEQMDQLQDGMGPLEEEITSDLIENEENVEQQDSSDFNQQLQPLNQEYDQMVEQQMQDNSNNIQNYFS